MRCPNCTKEYTTGAPFCNHCGKAIANDVVLNQSDAILIGRSEDCTYRINSSKVSQRHATLTWQANGDYLLQDLNSTNGTFLKKGGSRISGIHLKENNLVYFADQEVAIADIIAQARSKSKNIRQGGGPSGQIIKIGRDPANTHSINDQSISRFHAEIWRMADGSWQLKDCNSTNGTFINGAKINTAQISVHDSIRFGTHDVPAANLISPGQGVISSPSPIGSGVMPLPNPIGSGVIPSLKPSRSKSPLPYIIIAGVLVVLISLGGYFEVPGKVIDAFRGKDYLAKLVEQATVLVITENGTGSGFFIAKDTIITNQHVVDRCEVCLPNVCEECHKIYETVEIINEKGTLGRVYKANVIYSTRQDGRDYAVLRLDKNLDITPLKLSTNVHLTDEVFAWGYPGIITNYDPKMENLQVLQDMDAKIAPGVSYSKGNVRNIHSLKGIPQISHSAEIAGGNSGGPLVNVQGHVVGINTFFRKNISFENGKIVADDSKVVDVALGTADLLKFLTKKDIEFTQVD